MEKLGNHDSMKFIIKDDDKTIQLVSGRSISKMLGKMRLNNG